MAVIASSLLTAGNPAPLPRGAAEQESGPALAGSAQLDDAGLKAMLVSMGYEPKKLSEGYLVAVKQDSWTLNVQLRLSSNRSKLGFNANCGLVDEDAVSGAQWMALLISNGDIEPTSFYYDQEKKKLYLHRVIDNRDITPVILRKELDQFLSDIRSTGKLWTFTK
jgi:hypothetical protein